MEQKEIFFNNVIDSILSISLDTHVNAPNKVKSVEFNSNKIDSIEGTKFSYQFRGSDAHRFDVNIYKIDNRYFWRSLRGTGNGARYILDINVVKADGRGYGSRDIQVGRYFYDCSTSYNLKRLKEAFNFLVERIVLKKEAEDENKLLELNSKILINIDKSITRNSKLDDILKEK